MTEVDTRTLEEIKLLLLIQCKLLITSVLMNETEKNKLIYQLTGIKGQEKITKELNISPNTLSALWREWEEKGILIKDGRSYIKTIDKVNKIILGS